MNEWIRKTFGKLTPTYGKCGGALKDCAIRNLDPMDKLFLRHDNDLNVAETQADRDLADKRLHEGLKKLDGKAMKKIKWYKRPYAYLYRQAAIMIFKPKKEKGK